MQEYYIDLERMSLASDESEPGYYIPHHGVIKESNSTTKLRVVLDASDETSNDVLMTGPIIQDKLFEHLVRFRTHTFVFTADIEKMFRRVWVHRDDHKFQRI